jgi:ribosomal protein S18 acetylase RimI-like enzyme
VNVLAVMPAWRGRGLGTRLLALADATARARERRDLSVIVADANTGARRLYERCGYRAAAARDMVKEDWDGAGRQWVLLTKRL